MMKSELDLDKRFAGAVADDCEDEAVDADTERTP